jgi:histidine ammonia-lyase
MIIPKGPLTLIELKKIYQSSAKIQLADDCWKDIVASRLYLDELGQPDQAPIYGVNTGFGSLCNTLIAPDDLSTLQKNLLISHACGMGEEVPQSIVKLMLLLKIMGLSRGYSGVQRITIETLIDFYNNEIYPVVYQQGSLGASGDLAPLSHLCLPLLGLGEAYYQGKKITGAQALEIIQRKEIVLKSKEGLALINGTQFMSAYATYNVWRAQSMADLANDLATLSLEAYDGRHEPFLPHLHAVRPHAGQVTVGKKILSNLAGSAIQSQNKAHVQDPYSFRCVPQVHGASMDAIDYAAKVVETEINSVTDNPVVFVDEQQVVSGGHFHGQPLSLVMDFLCIAMAEVGSISERRVYKLIGGQRGLPAFLTPNPGLNSGFMIVQYTAASIVSQNKQLCTPAVVDTIDSSNGQEDHVSMGANAATKLHRVMDNLEKLLGIEWMTGAQALEFRRPLSSSAVVENYFQKIRQVIPFIQDDVLMSPWMHEAQRLVMEELELS